MWDDGGMILCSPHLCVAVGFRHQTFSADFNHFYSVILYSKAYRVIIIKIIIVIVIMIILTIMCMLLNNIGLMQVNVFFYCYIGVKTNRGESTCR